MEPSVTLAGVVKRFGTVLAVDHVDLTIGRGEFFSLLGPSGCGKTTLLRIVAGFEWPDAGRVEIVGKDVTGVPAHERPVNMVFQSYALFPHLSVADNVAFGLRYAGVPRAEWPAKVAAALALVRLEGFGDRSPAQLSGGQRQRVALARALVLEPAVLLLDEPLGALDQSLRRQVRAELRNLQQTLGITFLLVTHDQEEAFAVSDRIAVMSGGLVQQVGSPAAVFEHPANETVASFLGVENLFTVDVLGVDSGRVTLALSAGARLRVPVNGHALGAKMRCAIRPEKLELMAPQGHVRDTPGLAVTVEERSYQGPLTIWTVRDGAGERWTIAGQNREPVEPAFPVGSGAWLDLEPDAVILLGAAGPTA